MYYTILSRSGWQGDQNWRYRKTFTDSEKANDYIREIKSSDPKKDGYNVLVQRHFKSIHELTRWDSVGGGHIIFNDGTWAFQDLPYEEI